MSDLPPTWVLVLLVAAEIAIGIAMLAAPGFLIGWLGGAA